MSVFRNTESRRVDRAAALLHERGYKHTCIPAVVRLPELQQCALLQPAQRGGAIEKMIMPQRQVSQHFTA